MNFFDLFKAPDINNGIAEMRKKQNAVLLDVRTEAEYNEVHIPGSINIPLNRLQTVAAIKLPKKEIPFYVHCFSGSRSRQAIRLLKHLGYTDVIDIGGIHNYHGKTERGAAI